MLVNQKFFKINALSSDADEYAGFRNLLSNYSAAIRFKSCELLTFSTSPKVPVPTGALKCLTKSLHFLHDDTDAFCRGELLSTFRRFLMRFRQANSSQAIDIFLKDYMSFLKIELAPHVSYGRHILALDLICYIAETIPFRLESTCSPIWAGQNLLRSLFRLMLDPYDDVRSTASQALSTVARWIYEEHDSVEKTGFQDAMGILRPLDGASRLAAASNRADHADALGRIVSLLHTHPLNKLWNEERDGRCYNIAIFVKDLHN